MENNPVIFTDNEVDIALAAKLTKRIVTARVLVFIWAAFCFLVAVLDLIYPMGASVGLPAVVTFFCVGLFYMLLGIWSIRSPFAPILIVSIINAFLCLCWVLAMITTFSYRASAINIASTIIQFAFLFFMLRGVVAARKVKRILTSL